MPTIEHKNARRLNVNLMQAMNFGSKDLELNRIGRLSDEQRRTIRSNQTIGAAGWWLGALCATAWVIGSSHTTLSSYFLVIGSLLAVACVIMAFLRQYQMRRAIEMNEAVWIIGPILKRQIRDRSSVRYKLNAGDKSFPINDETYYLLDEGIIYNVYYEPETETLLSIEIRPSEDAQKRLSAEKTKNDDDDILIPDPKSQQSLSQ